SSTCSTSILSAGWTPQRFRAPREPDSGQISTPVVLYVHLVRTLDEHLNRDLLATLCRERHRVRRYRFDIPATAVIPTRPCGTWYSFVGTRTSVTSEDKNPIAAQLLDISDDATAIVQGALVQLAPLVERAASLRSQTAD